MKKKLMIILFSAVLCVGCGSSNTLKTEENNQETVEVTDSIENAATEGNKIFKK